MANEIIEIRLKVYDKEKLDKNWLEHTFGLYKSDSDREKYFGVKCFTFNLEDGKVEKIKMDKSEIFEEENEYYTKVSFPFPQVKDGSVIDIRYEKSSPFWSQPSRFYFQHSIPIVYGEYYLEMPDIFIMKPDMRGGVNVDYETFTKSEPNYRFDYTVYNAKVKNLKGISKEPFIFNTRNLLGSIKYQLVQYLDPGYDSEKISTSWEQICQDLNESDNFGKALKGNGFLDEKVSELISGASTELEKVEQIFQYVQTNTLWNGYNGIYTDAGLRKVFKGEEGNAADINLLLTAMLQKAGLEAYPVVSSTVSHGMIGYAIASRNDLNYVLSSVVIDNNLYLMDGTTRYSRLGMLPFRAINVRGFIVKPNGHLEVPLYNSILSKDNQKISAVLDETGKISGRYGQSLTDYYAMVGFMNLDDEGEKYKQEYFSDLELQEFKNERVNEKRDELKLDFSTSFSDDNFCQIIGKKMILNPLLFTKMEETLFNLEERVYPIEFGTAFQKTKLVTIKIPEGYKIEFLPEKQTFQLPDNLGGFGIVYEEKNGRIQTISQLVITKGTISQTYYQAIKEFYQKISEMENQEVVLVKE